VTMPQTSHHPFVITTAGGQTHTVDMLVGAFGVNSGLAKRFEELGFGYRRPRGYHVCQAEISLEPAFIADRFGDEIKIFSLGLPGIRFGALTPKRRHVTVTVIGRHVTRADLERFLAQPGVLRYLPAGWSMPQHCCHCHPHLPVTAARNAAHDRLLVIGDAHIARYLKGGIESAFFTGTLAAEAILAGDLSRAALLQQYIRPCLARYAGDNNWGRLLFSCNDLISRLRPITAAGSWLLRREQQMPRWEDRPHTRMLWHIFAGDAPYRHIALEAISLRAVLAVLHVLVRRHKEFTGFPDK